MAQVMSEEYALRWNPADLNSQICEGHFSAAERNPVSLDYSSYLFDRGMKPPFWGICGKVDAILLALSRTVRAESELLEHIARDTEESLAQHKQGSAWTPLREWEEMSTNMPQTQPCWEVEEGMAGADWGFVQSQCTLMQVVGDTKEALGEYQQDFDWTPSAVWEERSPKMEQLLPYCLELGGMARAT